MINIKTPLQRAKHCDYLATQFAETLLLSAVDYGFESIPSYIINGLVGIKLQQGIQYDIDSTIALFPLTDNHPTIADTVQHNAVFLCELFKLEPAMVTIMKLIIVMNANSGLRELLTQLSVHDSSILIHQLEQDTGLDDDGIYEQLQYLVHNNFVDHANFHVPDLLRIPKPFRAFLVSQKLDSRETFLKPILKYSPKAQFTLKQFEHVNADLVYRYLKAANAKRLKGVNILLYGDAGTGKTELSRTLAQKLGRNLIEVQSVQFENGKATADFINTEPTRQRLTYLTLLQNLIGDSTENLLLVDECESIFKHADEQYSKESLMRLMENNPVPAIWITNHVSSLEPSYIRRFKLVMEIPVPDEAFSYAMSKAMLKALKVSNEFRMMLATKSNAVPAYIANAAHVASTLTLTGEEAEEVVLEVIDATLDACGEDSVPAKYEGQLTFNPSCLNLKAIDGQDAQTIISDIDTAIANSLPVRVLLNGPPGTGKTGWVHHLAETHGMEVMHIKCSDVLSKYVGESEQNIAALFREAHKAKKLMLFDEVDSLLSKRQNAHSQHDVQLVNELLSQLECNTQPVFAATNALDAIDSAVMRRFDFKLTCDYLTESQRHILYKQVLGLSQLTKVEMSQLKPLQQLTPGDFAILARRILFQPNHNHRTTAIALLETESSRKQVTRSIGFIN